MRNSLTTFSRHFVTTGLSAIIVIGAAGCANDNQTKENLTAGFNALSNPSHDDEFAEALSHADAQIAKDPQGKGSAEAFYLRGRALEQRVKHSPQQADADLAAARVAYIETLGRHPSEQLEKFTRVSLGNVCYWQDDFPAALQQWQIVQGKMNDEALNAFALYRVGLCEQRLGNFSGADATFEKVVKQYPSSDAAMRAKTHTGFKYFAVQLATFANPKAAEDAARSLAREIPSAQHLVDPRGQHIVMVGRASNYTQALQLKSRFVARYPEAIIVP